MEAKIVLNVVYQLRDGRGADFVRELDEAGILKDVRSHEGCLKYEYFLPVNGADQLLLVEHWRDQAALEAHLAQPCMSELRKIKEKYASDTQVSRYTPI